MLFENVKDNWCISFSGPRGCDCGDILSRQMESFNWSSKRLLDSSILGWLETWGLHRALDIQKSVGR